VSIPTPAVALDADGFADVPLDGSPVQRSKPRIEEGPQALPSIALRGVHAACTCMAEHSALLCNDERPCFTHLVLVSSAVRLRAMRWSLCADTAGAAMKESPSADLEAQRLRDQLQRLKGELMRTSRAHEEEQVRAEAEADARVAALQRELSAAQQAAQAMRSELTHAQTDAAVCNEAATAAEAQVSLLRAQLDKASPTSNGDVSAHAHHPATTDHQTHAHEALETEAEELRRELDTLRTEHAAVVASLGTTERLAREKQQELVARLRDSEARCAELQAGSQDGQQGHERQLADLTRKTSALAQRMRHAEAAAQSDRAELDAERAAHAAAAEELARLRQAPVQQDQVQRLQLELDRALADLEGFGELHDATVAEVTDLRAQLDARPAQADTAPQQSAEVQRLQLELHRAVADLEGFGELHNATVAEVADLRTQLEARTAEAETATQQGAELQRLQLELDRALADLEGFGELHDATVAEATDLRAQLGARTADAETAVQQSADLQRLQVELDRALADLEGFGELHDATVAEVADLRTQLEARTAEADAAVQELSELRSASATSSARRGAADREFAELRAQAERQRQAAAVAEAEVRRLQQQLEVADRALVERDAFWQAELAAVSAAHEQVVGVCRAASVYLKVPFCLASYDRVPFMWINRCRVTGTGGGIRDRRQAVLGAGTSGRSAVRATLRERQPAVAARPGLSNLASCCGSLGAARSPAAAPGREAGPRRKARGAAGRPAAATAAEQLTAGRCGAQWSRGRTGCSSARQAGGPASDGGRRSARARQAEGAAQQVWT